MSGGQVPADAVTAAAEVFERRRPQLTGPEHKRLLPKFNAAMTAALEAAAPIILADAGARVRAEIVDEVTAITAETVLKAVAAQRATDETEFATVIERQQDACQGIVQRACLSARADERDRILAAARSKAAECPGCDVFAAFVVDELLQGGAP